jgi:uncharacterized membrane protein
MQHIENKTVKEKLFAAMSYLSFLCIVTLALKKESKFAVYHAKHGLVLFAAEVACFILSIIPLLGWLIAVLGSLLFLAVSIWGIIQSLLGKYSRVPVLSGIAETITL